MCTKNVKFFENVLVNLCLLLAQVICTFPGERCFADGLAGECSPLSECENLMREVRRAGTPLPSHIRRKLQSLSCGFQYDEPLVCCTEVPDSSEHGETEFYEWPPTHVMGGTFQHNHREKPHGNFDKGDWGSNDNEFTNNKRRTERPQPTFNFGDIGDDGDKKPDDDNDDKFAPPDVRRHRNIDLLPKNCGVIESDRIWGGNRTRLYEMPWMVLMAYESTRGTKLSCGGTLITEWYVLTAAHCVSFLGNRLKLSGVVLGEYDVSRDPDCERVEGELQCAPNVKNVSISKIMAHPSYSPQHLADDIALVKLSEPADFSLDSMKPICLPASPELQRENLEGVNGVVAGWGATEDGIQSSVLLSVELPIVSNENCQEAYNGSPRIYNRQLCAGGVQDKDSCGGDSGGPLVSPGRVGHAGTRYVQRGIVSYGSKRCGIGGFPGVYTRVAFYMDWILDNINN